MAKVAIDAGHGLKTSGKRCLKKLDPKETREWTLNNRVANYVQNYLSIQGIDHIRVDDTTGKTDVSLSARCKKANNWNADLYVSIHHNAGISGGTGGGVICFKMKGVNASKSIALRNNIYDCVIAETGLKGNRSSPKTEADFQVLRDTKMDACLIECGYMDSANDIKQILTDSFAKKCARGISKGITKTLGKTWKNEQSSSSSQPESTNFLIKVSNVSKDDVLYIREKPDASSKKKGYIEYNDPRKYTIIETKKVGSETWGKLKSEIGWINLRYTKRI